MGPCSPTLTPDAVEYYYDYALSMEHPAADAPLTPVRVTLSDGARASETLIAHGGLLPMTLRLSSGADARGDIVALPPSRPPIPRSNRMPSRDRTPRRSRTPRRKRGHGAGRWRGTCCRTDSGLFASRCPDRRVHRQWRPMAGASPTRQCCASRTAPGPSPGRPR